MNQIGADTTVPVFKEGMFMPEYEERKLRIKYFLKLPELEET